MAEYSTVCPKEKKFETFEGVTEYTQTGRTIATGKCPSCGWELLVVLATP